MPEGIDINRSIFRAYDVRGIYPTDLDEYAARRIGIAFGTYMGRGKRVVVGKDVRTSSPSLLKAMMDGLLRTGVDVTYIGTVSTPALYFAISHYSFDGGITVSASHNPPEWNGFKMCRENAIGICAGAGMERIIELAFDRNIDPKGQKRKYSRKSIMHDYAKFLSSKITMKKSLRVGVDAGNGAYAGFATTVLRNLGMEVVPINDVQDGRFPSRSPEPKPESITELRNAVKTNGLDFGVAFDGDGDRAVFVDEKGNAVSSDTMLAVLINGMVGKGDAAVYDISCSNAVEKVIESRAGQAVPVRIGRPFVKAKMEERNAVVGGELSGHLYFRDTYQSDDGLFAALKMAEILSSSDRTFSEHLAQVPKYERYVGEMDVEDSAKDAVIASLKASLSKKGRIVSIDGIKFIESNGWILLRASNTTPKIKVTVEAVDRKNLDRLVSLAQSEFSAAYGKRA